MRFYPVIVSDSLRHEPEQATIVAMYKRLLVGCAILSSPAETYITYLAVRAGWENAQIATYAKHFLILIDSESFLVPCSSILSAGIQTKTSLSMCLRIIQRWYYYYVSLLIALSDTNPTKLLYNRFGFKAEEFIVGFYEDYLDPQSRMSKNAFRLRLRR